jgi:hypothetical protein
VSLKPFSAIAKSSTIARRLTRPSLQLHRKRLEQLQVFRILPRLHAFAVGIDAFRVRAVGTIASETFFAVALTKGVLLQQSFQGGVDAVELVEVGGSHFPRSIISQDGFNLRERLDRDHLRPRVRWDRDGADFMQVNLLQCPRRF